MQTLMPVDRIEKHAILHVVNCQQRCKPSAVNKAKRQKLIDFTGVIGFGVVAERLKATVC